MGRPISIVHKLEVLVAPRIQCKDTKVGSRKDNETGFSRNSDTHVVKLVVLLMKVCRKLDT